jgi:hypothetical protein
MTPFRDPGAAERLSARFATLEQARKAIEVLERKGVEADDIHLEGPGAQVARRPVTNDEQRSRDQAVTGAVGRRAAMGGALGAVVGAAAGLLIGLPFFEGIALLTAVLGGAIVGFLLGFLFAGYSRLPVTEAWSDTFVDGEQGASAPAVVVVQAPGERVEELVEVLRAAGAEVVDAA